MIAFFGHAVGETTEDLLALIGSAWHYGWVPKAYSSLILKVPEEEVTLILLANSDGARAPFKLGAGNVLRSPIAVAFLDLFTDLKKAP